MYREQ